MTQLMRVSSKRNLNALRALLQHCHDLLDAANADIDHASCNYCPAEGYDGNGLKHDDDCIIQQLREVLNGPA